MATATPADTTKITRKTLIEKLNEDLAREYQAIIAYVMYSQVLKGAEYMEIAKELEVHAGEELRARDDDRQADRLPRRNADNEGRPVKQTEDAREMLRADLDNENATMRAYRERVAVRGAAGVRDRRRHPRDPAAGAGAPDRSGDRAR